jgi:hypothetical protein
MERGVIFSFSKLQEEFRGGMGDMTYFDVARKRKKIF